MITRDERGKAAEMPIRVRVSQSYRYTLSHSLSWSGRTPNYRTTKNLKIVLSLLFSLFELSASSNNNEE